MRERLTNAGAVGLIVVAVLMTTLPIYGFFLLPHKTDLLARYREGQAWLAGGPLYRPLPSVNMFPPWVTMLVFGPMARLPFSYVQVACVLLNAAALAISLRAIVRTLALSPRTAVMMTAALLSLHGMYQSWMLGQFTGLLLLPTTMAWIAYRQGKHSIAGAWLAPVIALKPTFALLALLLPIPVWLMAGGLSLAITIFGVGLTGFDVWRQWLAAGQAVSWLPFPFNVSFWGLVARWQVPGVNNVTLADLHPVSIAVVLLVIGALAWHAMSRRHPDARFFFATILSILASPLGWIYYLPLAAGPAAATWPRSIAAAAACTMLVLPIFGRLHGAEPIPGSMYFAGVMLGWVAWSWPDQSASYPLPVRQLNRLTTTSSPSSATKPATDT